MIGRFLALDSSGSQMYRLSQTEFAQIARSSRKKFTRSRYSSHSRGACASERSVSTYIRYKCVTIIVRDHSRRTKMYLSSLMSRRRRARRMSSDGSPDENHQSPSEREKKNRTVDIPTGRIVLEIKSPRNVDRIPRAKRGREPRVTRGGHVRIRMSRRTRRHRPRRVCPAATYVRCPADTIGPTVELPLSCPPGCRRAATRATTTTSTRGAHRRI